MAITKFRPEVQKLLCVLVPVGNAALFDGAGHLSQLLALPAFVRARLAKLAEPRWFQSIQHERYAFDTSKLLLPKRERLKTFEAIGRDRQEKVA